MPYVLCCLAPYIVPPNCIQRYITLYYCASPAPLKKRQGAGRFLQFQPRHSQQIICDQAHKSSSRRRQPCGRKSDAPTTAAHQRVYDEGHTRRSGKIEDNFKIRILIKEEDLKTLNQHLQDILKEFGNGNVV
jgi:hypothetical protein